MDSKLKILMVNWTWYHCGGDWTYISNLKTLYESHGHDVIPFSMTSPNNIDTKGFDKYFVEHIDYKELNKKKNISNGIRALSRSILSSEAEHKLKQLLRDQKIDIAHLHNIHHYLTPGILPVLKKMKIPVIWTLHDYTLICPEGTFLSNGKICEKCRGGRFYNCATQVCKKNSFLASSLAAVENYVHRYLHLFRHVDHFLCPSQFLFNKFRDFGFHPEKLVLTNLCFTIDPVFEKRSPENFILFVGRLEKYKGVLTLLKAVQGVDVLLYIAGDGTQAGEIRKYILDNQLTNVVMLGHRSKEEIYALLARARILICSSECYENFPFSVIEAMSLKTPVIASAIGGIPELVIHQQTGLLFEPFNFTALRENIVRLFNDIELQALLAENAYVRTASLVNFERHYNILKDVYLRLNLTL